MPSSREPRWSKVNPQATYFPGRFSWRSNRPAFGHRSGLTPCYVAISASAAPGAEDAANEDSCEHFYARRLVHVCVGTDQGRKP